MTMVTVTVTCDGDDDDDDDDDDGGGDDGGDEGDGNNAKLTSSRVFTFMVIRTGPKISSL